MYNTYGTTYDTTSNGGGFFGGSSGMPSGNFYVIWTIVAVILALVISIVVFVKIVKTKKTLHGKFTNWLKEFLNFRSIFIENLLKFLYLFIAIFMTLNSISYLADSLLLGLLTITFGNIFLRLIFEFFLMLIMIWKNTSDISVSAKELENSLTKKEEKHNNANVTYYSNNDPQSVEKLNLYDN